jgi:uncharacterized protein (TIGR02266 family)
MQGVEKRAYPRVPLVAKVDVESEGYGFLAVAQDISAGGMRVATANPLPVGALLEITFVVPDTERKIRARAVVRHVVEGSAMGVQFQNLSPEDAATIRAFVEKQ